MTGASIAVHQPAVGEMGIAEHDTGPKSAVIRVDAALPTDRTAWDAFVRATPSATFFHGTAWLDVVARSFGYRRRDLVARRGPRIVGVLPLFQLALPLGGSCLMSVPFAVEGGVCAEDRQAAQALAAAAVATGARHAARYVELRDGEQADGFSIREGTYCRFRRPLYDDDAANWRAIPRKQRRMIRIGQRQQLEIRTGAAHVAAFHDLYARSVRRLGSPVFGNGYFRRLLDRCGDDALLMTVWHRGDAVAGVLAFFFGDTVLPYYAGSRRDRLHLAPNDVMYWELMRLAVRRGARRFDFGRSKLGSGAYEYKRHWGFEPEPLRYRVHGLGAAAPLRSLEDPWTQRLRRCWTRLPLPLTKLAGPLLVRRLGPYYT